MGDPACFILADLRAYFQRETRHFRRGAFALFADSRRRTFAYFQLVPLFFPGHSHSLRLIFCCNLDLPWSALCPAPQGRASHSVLSLDELWRCSGRLFAGLLAPMLFSRVLEYPILVSAALFALPGLTLSKTGSPERKTALRSVSLTLLAGIAILGFLEISLQAKLLPFAYIYYLLAFFILLMMLFRRKALIVAVMLPLLFVANDRIQSISGNQTTERSFFGVHKLSIDGSGQFRLLSHGTTLHGAMRIRTADGSPVEGRPIPLTYYHPDGPIAETLRAVPEAETGRKIGVVGLGAGAHACNGQNADQWTYFEIDAAVERIARDASLFRFLSSCAPQTRIVIGDARLTLAQEPAGSFDNLLIDAFSSDAIPVHLMTREALALYFKALKRDGILTLHISNRHMELESVVGALAKDAKLHALIKHDVVPADISDIERSKSLVVALARSEAALAPLRDQPGWRAVNAGKTGVWSDDYSNILGAIWRHYFNLFQAKWGSPA
jgi:hypothetical protein